jgi:hypothetical protein
METTTTRTFSTVEEVFQACEEAGMMTRTQYGGLGEVSHWVDINHKNYSAPMTCFWSDNNLISWANAYFNTDWDAIEDESEDEDDDCEMPLFYPFNRSHKIL